MKLNIDFIYNLSPKQKTHVKSNDSCTGLYKTVLKEIRGDLNKYTLCSWIGRLNTVRMSILLTLI